MADPIIRGYTVFCDDIRAEIGGKSTFVGVYDAVLNAHGEFPFLLPKFGMAIRYIEQRGIFTDENVTLYIVMPGEDEQSPSIQTSMPISEMRNAIPRNPEGDPNAPRFLQAAANIVFAPLVIPTPGTIKIRAHCGAEVAKLGSLLVIKAPQKGD